MDFSDVIATRRAVNHFDSKQDVPDALLREVVEMAATTPSSFNLQPWSLMVLRDEEEKMRLRKQAMGQAKVSEAPVTLIVLADRRGWAPGTPFAEKNFQEMIKAGTMTEDRRDWFANACTNLYGTSEESQVAFATKNTGFFAMALMLAARSKGLHTHPMDGFSREGVMKEFNIPDHYWIPLLMAVGYFNDGKELAPPKWRKTYDEIVVKF
ncbi:nitroreductase family protein [Desulfoluna butyratoxydans]|uniref:Nitroreductase n=1 Tax=Desulfoluna butyratoxydans TaxID=231438 RepID=A0A4U8YVE6_9BACT|nr:nitroreductase family protein [Desulfoluna butyratoxydans]VFQ47419.1 nitroreductase [Desulfoluna butyratoxydans]